jgi:hypothetical protein
MISMEVIARVSFWVESIFIPTRGASGMYHGPQWPAGQHPTEMIFPLNIGIVQWITVEETTSYIYIY